MPWSILKSFNFSHIKCDKGLVIPESDKLSPVYLNPKMYLQAARHLPQTQFSWLFQDHQFGSAWKVYKWILSCNSVQHHFPVTLSVDCWAQDSFQIVNLNRYSSSFSPLQRPERRRHWRRQSPCSLGSSPGCPRRFRWSCPSRRRRRRSGRSTRRSVREDGSYNWVKRALLKLLRPYFLQQWFAY